MTLLIELLRALYGQVTGFGPVQDLPDVFPGSSEYLGHVWPVSNETALFWKFGEQRNKGEPFSQRDLAKSRLLIAASRPRIRRPRYNLALETLAQ
jgi:hypothetical protein